jgi:hypothetical protein
MQTSSLLLEEGRHPANVGVMSSSTFGPGGVRAMDELRAPGELCQRMCTWLSSVMRLWGVVINRAASFTCRAATLVARSEAVSSKRDGALSSIRTIVA